jgi:hypothetical protein
MTDRIGTCSICGGSVVTSGYMNATHCSKCGAVPAAAPGVIPMVQPRMPQPAHLTWPTVEHIRGE